MQSDRKDALLLPAGGARAAYQVGALRYIARAFPKYRPRIFSGVSAGSINACYLAQGDSFVRATDELAKLWSDLYFTQVFKTNFGSMTSLFSRWIYDLFASKVTNRLLLKSLLDASPLANTLLQHIRFEKVSRAIADGEIDGLSVTATDYHSGHATVFFDAHPDIQTWVREQRLSVRTHIRVKHILASCSIPLLFEPVRVGGKFYGDGSLRFNFPFSPALHLGATHILAVGIRSTQSPVASQQPHEHVSLGFVAGAVLNSIFLDSLEVDYENVLRINRLAKDGEKRQVQICLVRPSRDLGALAKEFVHEIPFHLRQALRALANREDLGDLLSYLMFSPGYATALIQLGEKDAQAQHADIAKALQLEDTGVPISSKKLA